MQKKLNNFLKKEIDKLEYVKFIERLTFEQLKRISVEKYYYVK